MKPLPTHSEGFGGRTLACSLSFTLTPGKAILTAGSAFFNGLSICVFTTLGRIVRSTTVCTSAFSCSVAMVFKHDFLLLYSCEPCPSRAYALS